LDLLQSFARDLVHATRALAKARAFTFVCVVTLGVGVVPVIGIPWASRLLMMPPPGVNTAGLVEFVKTARGPREASDRWSYADFEDLRDAGTGISMTGWSNGRSGISTQTSDGRRIENLSTFFVTPNFFSTLGVKLAGGRGFDAGDGQSSPENVVILGYDGPARSGPDLNMLGKTLMVDGVPRVVVGIAPDEFADTIGAQLFVPLEMDPRLQPDKNVRNDRDYNWIYIYGRLSPGVNIEQAKAIVSAVTSRLAAQYPATNEFKVGSVEPYDGITYGQLSELSVYRSVMFALTAMVLLIICLNISGMIKVRSAMREKELSIRQAIGASRARLAQYLLSEALILSAMGSALGVVMLFNIPPVLAWAIGQPIPADMQEALRPDPYTIASCIGLCIATSLTFGLMPALRFSRPAVISSLKDDAGLGGHRISRLQRVAVALQVGVAVPFLVLSGMLVDRVRSTATTDLGFETDRLAAVRLDLDPNKEKDQPGFFLRSVRANLEQASGVASITVADGLPLDFNNRFKRVSRQGEATSVRTHVTRVGEGYLNTMGIRLLQGRGITTEDAAGAELVTVISKPLADWLFPNDDVVIGQRLTVMLDETRSESKNDVFTIVGVTADFVTSEIGEIPEQLLVPLAQRPASSVFLVARSAAGIPPTGLTAAFENAVRDLDPSFRATGVLSGDELRQRSMRRFLANSAVIGAPGGITLALAALGIYGVVGLMVATRRREMAVRIALGASRPQVLGKVLFDVMKLVIPGVAGGLLIALVLVYLFREDFGLPLSKPGVSGLRFRGSDCNTGGAPGELCSCAPCGVGRPDGRHANRLTLLSGFDHDGWRRCFGGVRFCEFRAKVAGTCDRSRSCKHLAAAAGLP
jgi:predicted permease